MVESIFGWMWSRRRLRRVNMEQEQLQKIDNGVLDVDSDYEKGKK
jgi:hypothetical protein